MLEPIMFPNAKWDEPRKTENMELRSSGKAVTEATNTVPTTTLLMFKHEDNPVAPLTTLLEPQQSISTLTANARMLNTKVSTNIPP